MLSDKTQRIQRTVKSKETFKERLIFWALAPYLIIIWSTICTLGILPHLIMKAFPEWLLNILGCVLLLYLPAVLFGSLIYGIVMGEIFNAKGYSTEDTSGLDI